MNISFKVALALLLVVVCVAIVTITVSLQSRPLATVVAPAILATTSSTGGTSAPPPLAPASSTDCSAASIAVPSGWGLYTNDEDHYSIAYPSSSDATISHLDYRTGETHIGWSTSSKDTADISVQDSSDQDLTPAQLIAANERAALAGAAPDTTEQAVTPAGFQGILLFYKSGGFVEAEVYSTKHPDISLVFDLVFQAPEFATSYPAFWNLMLNSLTLSPFGGDGCDSRSCTCW
jgi:hypothetical protein